MERWYRLVLGINISGNSMQLFSIHTLSGCDTTPSHCGRGKIMILNNLFARDYPGLVNVLGEGNIKYAKCWRKQIAFVLLYMISCDRPSWSLFVSLYSQGRTTFKVMALSPTTVNLFQHVCWAHLQVMLWKAENWLGHTNNSTSIIRRWRNVEMFLLRGLLQSVH